MFEQILMLCFYSVLVKIRRKKQLSYYSDKDYMKVQAGK